MVKPNRAVRAVVFFATCRPLLVKDIKRHPDGSIKTGRVENGGWNLEMRDGEMLCKAGQAIVTRKADQVVREVPALAARGDYDEVIAWAEKQPWDNPATPTKTS